MGILGKTSGIFRLSSSPKSPSGRGSSTAVAVTPEEFRPLIQRLLAANTLESPDAKKVLREIKVLASACSPFLAASEIQRCVRRFSFTDADGAELDRSRAFELAAKLHWDNLHHQINDADDEGRPLGPTVYATFLDELLECLIQSKDSLTCVQIPLLLNEELLLKTLTPTKYTPTLITLITRTVDSILDYAVVRIEESAPSENGSEEEAAPKQTLPSGPILFIDGNIDDHLRHHKALLAKLGEEIADLLRDGNPFEGDLDDDTLRERKQAYFEVLAGVLERHGYDAFLGAVLGRLSELHEENDRDVAARYAERAAKSYAAQAAQDRETDFSLMAERHQHEADTWSKTAETLALEEEPEEEAKESEGGNKMPSPNESGLFGA